MIVFDKLKRGALDPPLQGYLDFGDGRDLSDVASVTLKMADENGNIVIDAAAEVLDGGVNNEIRYQWQAGQTDTVGNFWIEIWVQFNNGDFFKIPEGSDYINVPIPTDLPLPE